LSSILLQLPALVGVVVGAAASYLVGAATERKRWQREQSSRWDEKRAQAYSEYGYAVKNVYVQCLRIANPRVRDGGAPPANLDELISQLEVLTDERTAKWETVLLLGSPEAITAARTWHRRVWQVELFARGIRTDRENYAEVHQQIVTDRGCFYEAARDDLGIRGGAIPLGGPWEETPEPSVGESSLGAEAAELDSSQLPPV
jgi:hypothetical protein